MVTEDRGHPGVVLDGIARSRLMIFGVLVVVTGTVEILGFLFGVVISIALWAVTTSLIVVGLVFLISGFRNLSKADPSAFSVPALLSMMLPISLPILLFGVYLPSTNFVVASSGPPPPADFVPLFIWIGIIAVGGILGLIGWTGTVLGLRRVGVRYNKSSIKVAAILYIIPYLNIASGIMLVLNLRTTTGGVISTASPPSHHSDLL